MASQDSPFLKLPRELHIQIIKIIPYRHLPALLCVNRYFQRLVSKEDLARLKRRDWRAMDWKERRPPHVTVDEWKEVIRKQVWRPPWRKDRDAPGPRTPQEQRRWEARMQRLETDEPYLGILQWEQKLMGMTLIDEHEVGDESVSGCQRYLFDSEVLAHLITPCVLHHFQNNGIFQVMDCRGAVSKALALITGG